MSNPYEPSAVDDGGSAPPLGTPDGSGGLSVADAFSVESVFSDGWRVFKQAPAVPLATVGSLIAIQVVIAVVQYVLGQSVSPTDIGANLAAQGVGTALSLVAMIPSQIITAGGLLAIGLVAMQGAAPLGMIFNQYQAGIRLLLLSLLVGAIHFGIAIVVMIPIALVVVAAGAADLGVGASVALGILVGIPLLVGWAYVGLGLRLSTYAVVLDDRGPVDGLKVAWEKTEGARLTLLALEVAKGLAILLSACLTLGIGAVVLSAMIMAGEATAWLRVSRSEFALFGDEAVE